MPERTLPAALGSLGGVKRGTAVKMAAEERAKNYMLRIPSA